MDIPKIPIELTGNPFNVRWIERSDIKTVMDAELTSRTRLLIFYNKHKRLLISSVKGWLGITEYEHFSGKMMTYHSEYQKLAKGMSAEEFFKAAKSGCEMCKRSHVNLTKNNRRLIACTDCWEKFMSYQPETHHIRWTKIDCESYQLNLLHKVWKHHLPNNRNVSTTGLNLQTDYFIQTESRFRACSRCSLFAMGTIDEYCKFPCICGRASIVVSCCDKWHPPIPCWLMERWTTLRHLLLCSRSGQPLKPVNTIVSYVKEKGHGPETIKKNNQYDFSIDFPRVYKEYSKMHDESLEDEKKARRHMKSNFRIYTQTKLVFSKVDSNADSNDSFLKTALLTLIECRQILMHINIYQFYLKDSSKSGVSNEELVEFNKKLDDFSLILQKDISAKCTSYRAVESWVNQITKGTTELYENRKKFLDEIMRNGNFDFNVKVEKP